MKINVQKLDHVAIDVEDVEKAKTFYSDLLGLKDSPSKASTFQRVVRSRKYRAACCRSSKACPGKTPYRFLGGGCPRFAEEVRKAGFDVKWDRIDLGSGSIFHLGSREIA